MNPTHEGFPGELQSWERLQLEKELPQKLREEITSSHLKGLGYKKISKKCKIPRDTIGSIIRKFKTYGTAANLPGRGGKPNSSSRALKRNPCVRLQFYGLMKPNWNCLDIWTSGMSGGWKARLMTRRIPSPRSRMEAGTGHLDRVPGLMDSQKYQAILKRNVMPSVDKLNLGDHLTFQQDNDPKHNLQVNQSLVEEKILERPGVAFSVTRFKSDWKALVGFKEGSCSMEAIKHHWARGFCTWRLGKDSDQEVEEACPHLPKTFVWSYKS